MLENLLIAVNESCQINLPCKLFHRQSHYGMCKQPDHSCAVAYKACRYPETPPDVHWLAAPVERDHPRRVGPIAGHLSPTAASFAYAADTRQRQGAWP